jgi:2-iminobutanoate/2-iminopropanoate deaminase
MKNQILAPEAAQPGASYSQGFELENVVITAGQVGISPDGELGTSLEEQVNAAIDNLERVLTAGGSSLSQVVKTTCFLADVSHFEEFDRIYSQRFRPPFPARSTVGVTFAGDGKLLFEIEALALK